MGNCIDCRNWTELRDDWGSCEKTISINGSSIDIHTLAFAESEHGGDSYLECHADFGCNQWQVK